MEVSLIWMLGNLKLNQLKQNKKKEHWILLRFIWQCGWRRTCCHLCGSNILIFLWCLILPQLIGHIQGAFSHKLVVICNASFARLNFFVCCLQLFLVLGDKGPHSSHQHYSFMNVVAVETLMSASNILQYYIQVRLILPPLRNALCSSILLFLRHTKLMDRGEEVDGCDLEVNESVLIIYPLFYHWGDIKAEWLPRFWCTRSLSWRLPRMFIFRIPSRPRARLVALINVCCPRTPISDFIVLRNINFVSPKNILADMFRRSPMYM